MTKSTCIRLFFLLLFILYSKSIFCQGEANNWYFGINAGISFNTSPPSVLNDGQLVTSEGCSSISSANGDLLFYTDGRTVWNAIHEIMPNANYLQGSGLYGDPSSTSSGLIVPHPTQNNLYYVFTVDEPHHNNAFAYPNQGPANIDGTPRPDYADTEDTIPTGDDGFNNGFAFSVVDMNLNNGLGDIVETQKNIELITYDIDNPEDVKYKCSEKITAVRGENCNSVWVITHFKDTFYAFKIDENGIDQTPVTSQVGPLVPTDAYRRAAIGYLKASPTGDKLLSANQTMGYDPVNNIDENTGNVYLFDFDSSTGIVSNALELVDDVNAYGVEFSPEATKAYAYVRQFNLPQILQWDLLADDIPNSTYSFNGISSSSSGALQLAANGKIYCSSVGESYLAVINNPEFLGLEADYTESFTQGAIALGNTATFGLPPFIQSLFSSRVDITGLDTQQLDLCNGDSFTLFFDNQLDGASFTWTKDGEILIGEASSSILINQPVDVTFPYQETYTLEVDKNDGSCPLVGVANVTYYAFPEIEDAFLYSCVEDVTTISSNFNLNNAVEQILGDAVDSNNYDILFYETLQNAQEDENSILNPLEYENIVNPQTIFVTVKESSADCTSIAELTLEILDFQIKDYNLELCDDDQNGIQTFDLNSIVTQENLSVEEFYTSIGDALSQSNPIQNSTNYTMQIPNQDEVFFTINNQSACKDIGVLSLNVIDLPNLTENKSIFYCIEDYPNPITISSGISQNQLNSYTYFWLDSEQTTPAIEVNEIGVYEVAITDIETGCTNFRTIEVLESSLADFKLEIEEFSSDNNKITIVVSDNSLGDYEFAFDNRLGPYQDSNVFNNVQPGFYTVYIRDKNGCGSVQIAFGVIGIMEFFTPNNDGVNDVWGFSGVFNNNQALAEVYIFDRYGKLLQSFIGLDKSWDGFFNGKPMPSQDYWYLIKLEDGSRLVGNFTLKR